MHWFHGIGGGWMMILWWILIIGVIVVVVRWGNGSGMQGRGADVYDTPAEILKKRYARGEINREEFEEKMRILNAS